MALRELLALFKIEVDKKELKEGEKGIQEFAEKLKGLGEKLAVALGIESVREFIKGHIEAGAQLKITAERLGTTSDELQVMQFAAEQAGVGAESLSTALRILNRNISQAGHAGNKGAATFKELGISLKNADGTTRTSSELMGDFAEAISKIHDPAKQTEIAMKLLGRGGAQLLPLLKEGRQAFDDARKSVVELGGGLTEEFVEKAHKAEQQEKRLNCAITSLKTEVVTALLPSFERMIYVGQRVVLNAIEMAKHTEAVKTVFTALGVAAAVVAPTMTAITAAGVLLYFAFDELYTLLSNDDAQTLIGQALGPDKKQFVDDLRGAIKMLTGALGEDTTQVGELSTGWSIFREVVVDVAKVLAAIAETMAWIVDKGTLVADLFGSMSTDEGKAGRSWEALKARWADEGTGKHENIDKLRQSRNDKATSEQQAQETAADKEKAKNDWMVAQRYRKEFEERKAQWEAGGKQGKAPVMQPELAEFFANHQDPFAINGAPNSIARPNQVEWRDPHVFQMAREEKPSGPTVQQQNTFNIEVQTSSDTPQEHGRAVGDAGATAVQFTLNRALTQTSKP